MMHARNEIYVEAPPQRVYRYASDTPNWPRYLPHYRFVRVVQESGDRKVLEMGARRGIIPVRWRAEQMNDPLTPAIRFHHVRGWTKGMDVLWTFKPQDSGTLVSIDHDAALAFPMDRIAGSFISNIATRTLRRMKVLAERADG